MPSSPKPTSRKPVSIVLLLLVIAVAVLGWLQLRSPESAPPVAASAPPVPEVAAGSSVEPAIRHPVEALTPLLESQGVQEALTEMPPVVEPAPELGNSDLLMLSVLERLVGADGLGQFIVRDFVRRIVVTVDNLPGERLPLARSPVQLAPGNFLVSGDDAERHIAADNAARYAGYLTLAERIDSARLVAAYARLYPLFQAAYDELGYPDAYFNDRLVAVIDHMLAAPAVEGPIRMVQPKIRYQFAAPELEARSAGHKIMMRIGTDNAQRVKAKLAEIRGLLVGGGVPRQG